jgi:hypothetical protein
MRTLNKQARIMTAAYFCIPDADLLTPRHSRITRPVTAIETKNRVRVRRTRTALHGGRPALADFQLTPPFGSNMFRGETRYVDEGIRVVDEGRGRKVQLSGALQNSGSGRLLFFGNHWEGGTPVESPLPTERMRPQRTRQKPVDDNGDGRQDGRRR